MTSGAFSLRFGRAPIMRYGTKNGAQVPRHRTPVEAPSENPSVNIWTSIARYP